MQVAVSTLQVPEYQIDWLWNKASPCVSQVPNEKGLKMSTTVLLILQFVTWDLEALSSVPTYLANAAFNFFSFGSFHVSDYNSPRPPHPHPPTPPPPPAILKQPYLTKPYGGIVHMKIYMT